MDDDLVTSLVRDRINQTDCKVQGYLLTGYPKTLLQLKHLEEFRVHPSLIVVLECTDSVVIDRLTKRKLDPQTGKIYGDVKQIQD